MLQNSQLNSQFSRTLSEIKGELDFYKRKLMSEKPKESSVYKNNHFSTEKYQSPQHNSPYKNFFNSIDHNINDLLKENAELKERNCVLVRKAKTNESNTKTETFLNNIEHYEAETNFWKENFNTSEAQRKELHDREKKYKEIEQKLQHKIRNLEDLVGQLKERETKEKEIHVSLEKSLKEISKEKEKLSLENENLKEDVSSLLVEKEANRGEIRILEEKLITLNSEFYEFKLQTNLMLQEKDFLAKENEFFSRQLDEQLKEMNELRGSLKSLGELQSQENLILKRELQESNNALLIEQSNNSVMHNEMIYLQNELMESLETLKMMEHELNMSREKCENLDSELKSAKLEANEWKISHLKASEDVSLLKEQQTILEMEIASLSQDHKEVLGRSEKKVLEGTERLVECLKTIAEYIEDIED